MSKSFGNYKTVGVAYGSNTEFYRERRRHQRRVNKYRIRNVIANSNIENFDDDFESLHIPKENQWMEPTDGHYKVTYKKLKGRENLYKLYITKTKKIKK